MDETPVTGRRSPLAQADLQSAYQHLDRELTRPLSALKSGLERLLVLNEGRGDNEQVQMLLTICADTIALTNRQRDAQSPCLENDRAEPGFST